MTPRSAGVTRWACKARVSNPTPRMMTSLFESFNSELLPPKLPGGPARCRHRNNPWPLDRRLTVVAQQKHGDDGGKTRARDEGDDEFVAGWSRRSFACCRRVVDDGDSVVFFVSLMRWDCCRGYDCCGEFFFLAFLVEYAMRWSENGDDVGGWRRVAMETEPRMWFRG